MNIAHTSTFVLGGRHLLGIEGLSHSHIVGLLDPAEEFVELNRPFLSAISCRTE
jgi:aspartate carbamoyltransferase catalytic subunit